MIGQVIRLVVILSMIALLFIFIYLANKNSRYLKDEVGVKRC